MHAVSAQQSSGVRLSKKPNFSTEDRFFNHSDVLHIHVTAPHIDYSGLDKNEFELKPNSNGPDIEGTLKNHLNGTYSVQIPLQGTDKNETDWEVRIRLEDDSEREFIREIRIIIASDDTGDDGTGNDGAGDNGDDDSGDDDQEGNEIFSLTGPIDSIGNASISVGGISFLIESQTEFRDALGVPLDFSMLDIGLQVKVLGSSQSDGSVVALRITTQASLPESVEVIGAIDAVDGEGIRLAGMQFLVTSETRILNPTDALLDRSFLSVGMVIKIRGTGRLDGRFKAIQINTGQFIVDEILLSGKITSLSDTTVSILNHIIYLMPQTEILSHSGQPISIRHLALDQTAQVRGDMLTDRQLIGLQLKLTEDDDSAIVVEGPLQGLNNGAITVAGVPMRLDASAQFFDQFQTITTRSTLSPGQTLRVSGSASNDNLIRAEQVHVQNVATVSGEVKDVAQDHLVLFETRYVITSQTLIIGEKNMPLPRAAIKPGTYVEIRALSEQGNAVATKIKIRSIADVLSGLANQPPVLAPAQFQLHQNYPNPFHQQTTILFDILEETSQSVRLIVYDAVGREISRLVDSSFRAGRYEVTLDPRSQIATGIYFYRLEVNGFTQTRRFTVVR